ncbi:MAG: LPXTG cell wall anchor domain-containing protein, partial [Coriobacteriales bacterium]|nr:LPXTG cell wall anchor domain-containing protein [Coriobacteriales bacterium]
IKGLDNAWTYTLKEITVPKGYNQAADKPINGDSLTKVDKPIAGITLFKETVVNRAGTELPSTGGIGTTIFYVVGGAMVLCGIVMLITKSRLSKTEE